MKKPTIKNWIKYCAGTLAMSGMLLTTGCDTNNEAADYENEVEATETEPVVIEREDVADVEPEEEEVDYVADEEVTVAEEERTDVANTAPYPDQPIGHMDEFLDEHEEVNEAIKRELTDNDNVVYQDVAETQDTYQAKRLVDQQGRENVADTEADRREQEAIIISLYEIDLDRLTEEDRERMDAFMAEYRERRDRERGQMSPETGAYISPEVDARPEEGYEELMANIQERIEYPHNAQAADMEGTVLVSFIVDETGDVTAAEAVEYVNIPVEERQYTQPLNPTKFSEQEVEDIKKEMMKEAEKAVKATSGEWEPAMQNGEVVRAELQLPVRFRIAENE